MKDILTLMARYNKEANNNLYDIVAKLDPELLIQDSGSYFGDILGLLNHVLVSDLGWLTAYRDGSLSLPSLESEVLDFQHPGWAQNLYNDFEPLRDHRVKLDQLIIDFIQETDESLFEGTIEITRASSGKKVTFPFGKILMHFFNHQTHHRGAISQILDQNKVENDYSNILPLLLQH